MRINGPYENEPYYKNIRQIGKFSNYPNDVLQKLVGVKIQVLIENGFDRYGIDFYDGIIKNVSQSKTNGIYIISTILKPSYELDANPEPMDITVDLTQSSYKNNELLDGKTSDGKNAEIKISNKKARLAIASLLNYKGNDEFLKKI